MQWLHIACDAIAYIHTFMAYILWSNGLVVKMLDSQSRAPDSRPLSGSKFESAFHPAEVNEISTSNSWGLSDKK